MILAWQDILLGIFKKTGFFYSLLLHAVLTSPFPPAFPFGWPPQYQQPTYWVPSQLSLPMKPLKTFIKSIFVDIFTLSIFYSYLYRAVIVEFYHALMLRSGIVFSEHNYNVIHIFRVKKCCWKLIFKFNQFLQFKK